eukprot:248399_1
MRQDSGDNLWMNLFVDFENILKCANADQYDILSEHLLHRTTNIIFPMMDIYKQNEWEQTVNETVLVLNEIRELKSDQIAQIQLAEVVENVLFATMQDTMFSMIVVALYFL